jgi:hypothetical protein
MGWPTSLALMELTNHVLALSMAVLWGALASGCATMASASCRPGDSTVACCIKKYPLSPVESCAASPEEVLKTLAAMDAAFQSTRHTEDEDEEDDADDFANNAPLPPWKQECIRNFVYCQTKRGWVGPCYDCLRRCEGQHQWPFSMCWQKER